MPCKSISFLKKVGLSVFCSFIFWSCENDVKDIKALTEKKGSVETIIDVQSFYSQQAKMKAKLTAPLLMKYNQVDTPYWEFPRSLHVEFFDDSLKVENQVNARYGKYIETRRLVFLKDSVVMFNLKGDTLFCRELWWDQQKQIFYTDKAVRIHQPDKIVYGTGLEAAQNFGWFKTKEAHGFFRVPKSFEDEQSP